MWPTSEQTACTFTGGISVLRQNTLDFGNESVGDSCSTLLTGNLFQRIGSRIVPQHPAQPPVVPGTEYNHLTVFPALPIIIHFHDEKYQIEWYLSAYIPFRGDYTWKQWCLCNVRIRTLEERMFFISWCPLLSLVENN